MEKIIACGAKGCKCPEVEIEKQDGKIIVKIVDDYKAEIKADFLSLFFIIKSCVEKFNDLKQNDSYSSIFNIEEDLCIYRKKENEENNIFIDDNNAEVQVKMKPEELVIIKEKMEEWFIKYSYEILGKERP